MRVRSFVALKPAAMKPLAFKLVVALFILANFASLTACSALGGALSTPTPTATNTPKPTRTARPTKTPRPTPTFTEMPTAAPTLAPPSEPAGPKASTTPLTDPVKVYYIKKDEKGPWGCNEQLYWLNTKIARTGNIVYDVTAALKMILNYHNQSIGGGLYNPGYQSALSVQSVSQQGDGSAVVYLTGTYNKSKDPCDGPRFRDQLKQTVKQFPGVTNVIMYINGTPIGDVLARK